MKYKVALAIISLSVGLFSNSSWAWGRRGHSIVGETAGMIVAKYSDTPFLRNHSYDLGYYCNVPDFIWKRPATYEFEKPNLFIDLEIFTRSFAMQPDKKAPFLLSREEFDKEYPDIPVSAGRAYWRIRELLATLDATSDEIRALKDKPDSNAEQRKLQEKWIVVAGVMGHYIGDLGMPLHVSENYDGQKTGQKGLHSYFEDLAVDELYPSISIEVHKEAMKQWPAFTKKNGSKPIFELVQDLANQSAKAVPEMLAIDKKVGRKSAKKSAEAFRPMIRRRLVAATLVLGEIYRRGSRGWTFDDNRFFYFAGEPEYIYAPGSQK